MNTLLNKLMILVIIIASAVMSSCEKDELNTTAPYFISFTEEGDTTPVQEIIKVASNENSLSFCLLLTGDGVVDDKDISEYTEGQRVCYLDIKPVSVGTELGIKDYTSTSLSWPTANLTSTGENSWEADGLTITKSVVDGHVYINFHLNPNKSGQVKYYKIAFAGYESLRTNWCIETLYIEQAAELSH